MKKHMITHLDAREILDCRGEPTVQVALEVDHSIEVVADVPAGRSTGVHEASELRDGETRYAGRGVSKAVNNVIREIAPLLVGMDVTCQREIDARMIECDGTENKSRLGANAILAVSMAVCKAGASAGNLPLYEHVAQLGKNKKLLLPVPMALMLEGGKHADKSSDFQEFMLMPYKAKNFREAIRWASEIYHSIGKVLKSKGFSVNVGHEGAYAPSLGSNEKTFRIIIDGIREAGYKPHKEVIISIDPAASEFFDNGKYNLKSEGRKFDGPRMIDYYSDLTEKYPIFSIEDGLADRMRKEEAL